MASPALSSDEGEIVEATPLPRSEQNGDVDRPGRHRGRFPSRTPEDDLVSRGAADGARRRSRSPRGWKRHRDDHRDRRDPRDTRHFRIHYEDGPRDDRRHGRDLDRPSSRGSDRYDERQSYARADGRSRGGYDRGYDRGRRHNGYPDKRPRTRSRSPPGRPDRARRDRGRIPDEDKYSAQAERRSREGSISKRATPVEAPGPAKQNAKSDQGATVERGMSDLALSQTR